jgi:D-amino-acid dehydrogenase
LSDDVVVVGGGVVGMSSALALARTGRRVRVIEPDGGRAAPSWGNAGHLAIEQVEPLASRAAIRSAPRRLFARGGALDLPLAHARHWAPFAWGLMRAAAPARFERGKRALASLLADAMPAWHRLDGTLPGDPLVREDGHFVLWPGEAAARAGRSAWSATDTGTARFRDATEGELAWMRPFQPAAGIRFTNSGQVTDLAALATALEAAFTAAGGMIQRGRAGLVAADGKAAVRVNDEDPVVPKLVVLAAGVASGRLVAPLGHRAPIVAERGYHLRSTDHDWPAGTPPVVFEDRSMIVTRYADAVQVASFVELGHADAAPDPRKWDRLEAHIRALGLPIRGPLRRWMGPRPTLPDYLPAIGRSERAGNLLYAFGHQHLGLTLAPITAEIVAALVEERAPPVDLAPFSLARFDRRRRLAHSTSG